MLPELVKFIGQLHDLNPSANDTAELDLYKLIEPIESIKGADAVIPEIFRFFERFPDADLGSPGPLVHFIEKFYPIYIQQLVASVERQPTSHTLWMVNRILNSKLPPEQRSRLLQVLKGAINHPKAGTTAKKSAAEFLAHQGKEG